MNPRCIAVLGLAFAASLPAQDLLVRGARLVLAPDTILNDEALLVRDGKIAFVGKEIPEESKRGAKLVDLQGKWIVPAFALAHSQLGQMQDLGERIDAVTPDLLAAEAFDPFEPTLARMAKGGVAWVGFAPNSGNPIGGLAAVVRTGKPGAIAVEATYLKLALCAEAFDQNRMPTSLLGAAELLRTRFAAARAPSGAAQGGIRELKDVLSGARKLVVHVRSHAEITTLCELAEAFALQPVLVDADEAEKSLPRLAALKASVILAPLAVESPNKMLRLPALLEAQRIPFSFRADRPDQLRLSAALALRSGASRTAALAALTRVPAEQCSAPATAGQLRAGGSADFLVFSGDPLDLTSRHEATWLAGKPFAAEGGPQ